ncbi:LysR family transcriptional regulator [Corticimicrobacter populi]|uniref:LysR family transcriptional regulator n=1 Tax=Corticimicrobacter populi TaxID=2175229 RepID=A0A2V1K393_9BURK|nr:LysR family transcriptional regulator [Corticimicrobacter populi]PWF24027.1 LysR family transcriptional regulator [Corticimicrobacter populi]
MDELRRIDLNLLLTLHAILMEKHVSRAALRLHRSQPAVSHSLAQLRSHFDDPLLVRKGGKFELTTRAEALVTPLSEALSSLNALMAAPDFDPAKAERRFRLALSDYATRAVLPRLTQHVRQYAPGIALIISQASREAMLAQLMDGELDLALGIFPNAPAAITQQTLFCDRFVCVADKHVLPESGVLTLDEWLARPHVMVSLRPDANDEIEQALAAIGRRRHLGLVLPHWGAAVEAIVGTDLVLTIAQRAVDASRLHSDLRLFTPPIELPEFQYQQAWHERRSGDVVHRWVREVVLGVGAE